MVFENLMNPVLAPLLKLGPFWLIFIVSLVISLIINFVYKLMTNQVEMKGMKDKLKYYQKQMKELKHDPKAMMDVQKKAMEINMKYMTQSFKPTLITLIPLLLIFGWLNTHLGYIPIMPGEEFTTTMTFNKGVTGYATIEVPEGMEIVGDAKKEIAGDELSWKLKGDAGEYLLEYKVDNSSFTKDVLITEEQEYKTPKQVLRDDQVRSIEINQAPLIVTNLGFWKIGWLGTYIILSLIMSMGLRKLMKLY